MIRIAAPDASPQAIAEADYLTDGTDDDAVFAKVITESNWIVTEGTFYLRGAISGRRGVTIDGQRKTTFTRVSA